MQMRSNRLEKLQPVTHWLRRPVLRESSKLRWLFVQLLAIRLMRSALCAPMSLHVDQGVRVMALPSLRMQTGVEPRNLVILEDSIAPCGCPIFARLNG
jgi:hypothetical protein